MSTLQGIILYDMQLNGYLNGVYTNNRTLNAELYTETARLQRPIENAFDDFRTDGERTYDCFYFDAESGSVNATLMLQIVNGIITTRWWVEGQDIDNDRPTFAGQGYQMNQRQITIAYTD